MGRWGTSELTARAREVSRCDDAHSRPPHGSRVRALQIERCRRGDRRRSKASPHRGAPEFEQRGGLRAARRTASTPRCRDRLYGLSPFGSDPLRTGSSPILSWTSEIAAGELLARVSRPGTGGRFVGRRDTWIGIVPAVGYGDDFRRDMTAS